MCRLSARRPNLQNQPALEKVRTLDWSAGRCCGVRFHVYAGWQDRYKIRDAFTCEPGNTLIVADYGQLELRVLAHMVSAAQLGRGFTCSLTPMCAPEQVPEHD